MSIKSAGLASEILPSVRNGSSVRHYTGALEPPKHAHSVYVKHAGSEWLPATTGSQPHAEQTYRELREEMLRPITGIKIVNAKGDVVSEEVVEEGQLLKLGKQGVKKNNPRRKK